MRRFALRRTLAGAACLAAVAAFRSLNQCNESNSAELIGFVPCAVGFEYTMPPGPAGDAFEGEFSSLDLYKRIGDGDNIEVLLEEIQGLQDGDVKYALRAAYSPTQELEIRNLLPQAAGTAIQGELSSLGSSDEAEADLRDILQRFGLVFFACLKEYAKYYSAKAQLSEPNLDPQLFRQTAATIIPTAQRWKNANMVTSKYLSRAASDLDKKWGDRSETDTRLKHSITLLEGMAEVFEAQREHFDVGLELTKMRFLSLDGKQADLVELWENPEHKRLEKLFEKLAVKQHKLSAHCKKVAESLVTSKFISGAYLLLLPVSIGVIEDEAATEAWADFSDEEL